MCFVCCWAEAETPSRLNLFLVVWRLVFLAPFIVRLMALCSVRVLVGSGPRGRVWCDDSALTLLINHRAWKSLAARHAFLRWSTAWGREMPSDQILRNKTTIFSHILTLMTFKPVIYSEKHIVDHNSSSYLSSISSLLKSCDALDEKHTFKLLFTKNRPVHHSSEIWFLLEQG